MSPIVIIAIILIWIYILSVFSRAKMHAWKFIWGSLGLFVIMMITVQPVLTMPLARCVAALAGVVGNITGTFIAYFKYGIIFISSGLTSVTLRIDFECSGIIEIMAFISLLAFFNVYNFSEKVMVGIGGFCYIMVCNAKSPATTAKHIEHIDVIISTGCFPNSFFKLGLFSTFVSVPITVLTFNITTLYQFILLT